MDGRKRHKRGRMMKGGGILGLGFGFGYAFGGFCFGGGMWRKRRDIKLGSGEC